MRAYECSLTADGKAALLELLLATEQSVRIKRSGSREEWRIGGRLRYEWCIFGRQEGAEIWNVTFGGNFKRPGMLEPLFAKTVSRHKGCSWVWLEKQ